MNANSHTTMASWVATKQAPMSSLRKTSLTAGLLYLLSFVSIPTLALYSSIHQPDYVIGTGPDTPVIVGCILEIIVALAGIGTALILFPVLKKQSEVLALGLVASRVLEACTMFVGIAFLLSVVTLRQAGAGAEALVTSHALVALYDRIFLIGQSLMPAINALLLGTLLYRSRLVPRVLPLTGFLGAALLIICDTEVLFGYIGQHAASTALAAIPIALWEFSLGIYFVVKGFKPSSSTAGL